VALWLIAWVLPSAGAVPPPLSPGRTFAIVAEDLQVDGGFANIPAQDWWAQILAHGGGVPFTP